MTRSLVNEVARREIRTRSRTKAFRVITGILVAAAIGGPIVAALWPSDDGELRKLTVGLVQAEPAAQQRIEALAAGRLDMRFTELAPAEVDAAAVELAAQAILAPFHPTDASGPRWSTGASHAGFARSLEVLSADLCDLHAFKPPNVLERHAYGGGPERPDCVEMCLRELFDLLL